MWSLQWSIKGEFSYNGSTFGTSFLHEYLFLQQLQRPDISVVLTSVFGWWCLVGSKTIGKLQSGRWTVCMLIYFSKTKLKTYSPCSIMTVLVSYFTHGFDSRDFDLEMP